jgi:hypothetical protein
MPSAPIAPRARPGRGRASAILTTARVKAICDLVEKGVPQAAAAGASGIPRRTYQEWLAKGREPGAPEPYASLAEKMEAALDRFHMSRAVIVAESSDERTAIEVLRRRFKDDWGDPERQAAVNISVTLEAERRSAAQQLVDAAIRVLADQPELLERLLAEIGGGQVINGAAIEAAEIAA